MSHSNMPVQVFGVHESLLTVFARKRILLGVFGDLVVFQVLLAVEALGALRALVQRMIDVFRLVLLELVFARESHVTVNATKGSNVAVTRERVAF